LAGRRDNSLNVDRQPGIVLPDEANDDDDDDDGEDDRSMTSADPAIFSRGRGGARE